MWVVREIVFHTSHLARTNVTHGARLPRQHQYAHPHSLRQKRGQRTCFRETLDVRREGPHAAQNPARSAPRSSQTTQVARSKPPSRPRTASNPSEPTTWRSNTGTIHESCVDTKLD